MNSKRRTREFPPVLKYQRHESGNDNVISNMFVDFFAPTYSDSRYDISDTYPYHLGLKQVISFPFFEQSEVVQGSKSLKSSFNHGPDGVPSSLLISCADSLSIPLTLMFNTSIKFGYFSKHWRESFIIPLFKSGSKLKVKILNFLKNS